MPIWGDVYIDRSAEHRAAEERAEARRLAKWQALKDAFARKRGG